jgi:hypothetical protein
MAAIWPGITQEVMIFIHPAGQGAQRPDGCLNINQVSFAYRHIKSNENGAYRAYLHFIAMESRNSCADQPQAKEFIIIFLNVHVFSPFKWLQFGAQYTSYTSILRDTPKSSFNDDHWGPSRCRCLGASE